MYNSVIENYELKMHVSRQKKEQNRMRIKKYWKLTEIYVNISDVTGRNVEEQKKGWRIIERLRKGYEC